MAGPEMSPSNKTIMQFSYEQALGLDTGNRPPSSPSDQYEDIVDETFNAAALSWPLHLGEALGRGDIPLTKEDLESGTTRQRYLRR